MQKTKLSEALEMKNLTRETFRDFSILVYKDEVNDFEEIEKHFMETRTVVQQAKDTLSCWGYLPSWFAVSEHATQTSKHTEDLKLLWNHAPSPWRMRSSLHFKVTRFLERMRVTAEMFTEVKSGEDCIYRKRFKLVVADHGPLNHL